jgi:hypothetical protein
MVQYDPIDPNDPNDEWDSKKPTTEDILNWRGNLYWLFDDVDKAVNVPEKKLIDNREDATYATYATLPEQTTTVAEGDVEYSIPFDDNEEQTTTVAEGDVNYSIPLKTGGRKTKRRKYKKTNKRRLKRKRTKKYSK